MEKEKDILEKFSKVNPYRVPDGYFESLTDKINSRIDEIEAAKVESKSVTIEPESKQNKIWLTLRPILSVAAVVAMLVAVTYVAVKPKIETANNYELALAEEAEYESDEDFDDFYFDDYEFDLDELEGLAFNY